VVVADDQATIREALAAMLDLFEDIDVVGTAEDGAVAADLVDRLAPDVLLTDLRMPVLDGAGATARVLAAHPDVAVVVLTTYDDEESVLAALQAGARGYLTKEAGREEIAAALRTAAAGQAVLDPSVQARLVRAASAGAAPTGDALPDDLTAREVEVLTLIGEGLSNRELAHRLFVSEATVKTHVNNLFAKTGVRDRAQAVGYAYRHGLVRP
jgi:DNA-binding NarL/FixJ family response regulator